MKELSNQFRALPEEQRNKYNETFQRELAEWKIKHEEY